MAPIRTVAGACHRQGDRREPSSGQPSSTSPAGATRTPPTPRHHSRRGRAHRTLGDRRRGATDVRRRLAAAVQRRRPARSDHPSAAAHQPTDPELARPGDGARPEPGEPVVRTRRVRELGSLDPFAHAERTGPVDGSGEARRGPSTWPRRRGRPDRSSGSGSRSSDRTVGCAAATRSARYLRRVAPLACSLRRR